MVKELWKPVVGFEGIYEVSNLGNVRSLDRIVTYRDGRKVYYKGKILSQKINIKWGYKEVVLYKHRQGKTYRVNRLVALAFLPNPDNLPEVNHIDEDKTNNKVDNLEWCSRKYNCNYGNRVDKYINSRGIKIQQLDCDGSVLHIYRSISEACRSIQCNSNSGLCYALKHSGKYKGYYWKEVL